MLMGLWRFSSPARDSASRSNINLHFRNHVESGLGAYYLTDLYGDGEVTFGQFRHVLEDSEATYCATK
ncbi:hypothetical protein DSL72_000856 [Monilinia vaccinii-corymbosi]|uniref:Uncharacterized protein n=1 Tax=Monilinia vaccinii-corymbosi TaxID=61207 RepID=A0A8A3P0H7_9HELO|nr:hypothetical protein DSL72_000856 [Monilinia vaccinii-corymbosi]